jgi:hypothetical protein
MLGSLIDSPIPVHSARELREAEILLQTRLDQTAIEMSTVGHRAASGEHVVWQRAVAELSGGKIELIAEYPSSLEAFYARVRELTSTGDVGHLGAVFSSAVVRTPVLTSVTRLGKGSYPLGHIVTIYGLTGDLVEPTPIAVLNSAVKVADKTRMACDIGDVANDEKWSAIVSLESSYQLTSFNGCFLILWLRHS